MLDSVWFSVSDMDRATAFYSAVLMREPSYSSEYWTSFDLGNAVLGLHGPSDPEAQAPSGGWVVCVATDDVRGFMERAGAAGAKVEDGFHQTPRGVVASFCDPDGNRLQAMQLGARVSDRGH